MEIVRDQKEENRLLITLFFVFIVCPSLCYSLSVWVLVSSSKS